MKPKNQLYYSVGALIAACIIIGLTYKMIRSQGLDVPTNPYIETQKGKSSDSSSKLGNGSTVDSVLLQMVTVKGGAFELARNGHRVSVNTFNMCKTEVTQAQWQTVMGNNPSRFKGFNLPVTNVSWDEVQDFIAKLNRVTGLHYRLPSENEWEYAAGGGENGRTLYAGANTVDELNTYAWYENNDDFGPRAVAAKQPNQLGLYDMSGNVWEWCQDWHESDNKASLSAQQEPGSGTHKVYRGGGWSSDPLSCRSGCRAYDLPSARGDCLGFRLVLTP